MRLGGNPQDVELKDGNKSKGVMLRKKMEKHCFRLLSLYSFRGRYYVTSPTLDFYTSGVGSHFCFSLCEN